MSLAAVNRIIADVQAASISGGGPSRGVQPANYFRGDVAWDPAVPMGHVQYTWTGHTDAAAANTNVFIPLQIRAYASAMALEAEAAAAAKPAAKAPAVAASSKAAPAAAAAAAPAEAVTGLAAYQRLDIRVGRIVSVARHPEADKLYVEQIDVGEAQPRQILSGLVPFIPIEEMQNAMLCVICNLKPAKLKGIESQGMVLAAGNAEHTVVELITPPAGAKVGERLVLADGSVTAAHKPDAEINIKKAGNPWDGAKDGLRTNAGRVACFAGVPLHTSAGPCLSKTLTDSLIA